MDNIAVLDTLTAGASRITAVVHVHPDGDALGSGLALISYLASMRGKDAVLIVPDSIPESLAFMTGGPVMVFGEETEVASGRITGSDLLFCLDCNSFSRTCAGMEALLKASGAPKILIDHHLNPESEDFSLVFSRTEVSSTSELLFWILKEMPDVGGDVSRLPMTCLTDLLTGMTTDTNNFANSVFPGTLRMAAELIAAGVDRDSVLRALYNNYRENRIRLMGYMLHSNMEITPEGVAFMVLDKAVQSRFDFRPGESEGFVNMPLAISSVRMSIMLTEEDERFRVSIRSKEGVSANIFAKRYFGGGGHELAAGGKLPFGKDISSPEDAKAYILKVTGEFFAR